jgi:hypothetical protein
MTARTDRRRTDHTRAAGTSASAEVHNAHDTAGSHSERPVPARSDRPIRTLLIELDPDWPVDEVWFLGEDGLIVKKVRL